MAHKITIALCALFVLLLPTSCWDEEDYSFEKDGDRYFYDDAYQENGLLETTFTATVRKRRIAVKTYTFSFDCKPLTWKWIKKGDELKNIRRIVFHNDLSLGKTKKYDHVSGHITVARINRITQEITLEFNHFGYQEDKGDPVHIITGEITYTMD